MNYDCFCDIYHKISTKTWRQNSIGHLCMKLCKCLWRSKVIPLNSLKNIYWSVYDISEINKIVCFNNHQNIQLFEADYLAGWECLLTRGAQSSLDKGYSPEADEKQQQLQLEGVGERSKSLVDLMTKYCWKLVLNSTCAAKIADKQVGMGTKSWWKVGISTDVHDWFCAGKKYIYLDVNYLSAIQFCSITHLTFLAVVGHYVRQWRCTEHL